MPYIFQSMKDTEKLTDSSKLYNFMKISFLLYAVKSKRYLVNQSMKQKIWKIFFYIAF